MPNRILKESICTSDTIDKLTSFEEICWYRLIVNVDDYGRTDARLPILKSRLFPLRSITDKQLTDVLNKFTDLDLIYMYEFEKRPYIQIVTWSKHQTIRTKKSKYPPFDTLDINDIKAKFGDSKISINSPVKEKETKKAEPIKQTSKTIINLVLNDNSLYPITEDQIKHWQGLYPAVNVMQSLRNMSGWLEANPKKRKTKSGILRFVTSWLSKEQDKGGNCTPTQGRPGQQVIASEKYAHDSAFV